MCVKRLVKQLLAESPRHGFTGEYWDSLAGTLGKSGPVSFTRHTMGNPGWGVCGKRVRVHGNQAVVGQVAEKVKSSQWKRCAPRGLDEGRDAGRHSV